MVCTVGPHKAILAAGQLEEVEEEHIKMLVNLPATMANELDKPPRGDPSSRSIARVKPFELGPRRVEQLAQAGALVANLYPIPQLCLTHDSDSL